MVQLSLAIKSDTNVSTPRLQASVMMFILRSNHFMTTLGHIHRKP
jgi:hypothetical protein